ncbi:polymeric immunoglobulin receptor-like [Cygnus atratus]|uniref:polymeric immunoglobulin receptor-like n=1 Tax=Cygnus atratus TaxID=8868 RepID=UPI0015D5C495|nr:polymeric immunoglobulin receptor-like [Cygnus atratus]
MELRVFLLLLLLCFPGLQAQTPGEVSKREGSNLSVLCPYLAEDEYWELKSWCRWTGQGFQRQVAIISTITYQYTDRARQGHVTIQDDPIHRNFSITMTDLQVEDSGTYYCAYSHSNVPLKRISLNVFKEFHKWELDSLSVQCPYRGQVHLHGRKAWCRYVDQTGRCELVVSTDTTYTWSINKAQKDRASIQDDTQKRTITITMEKLQAQDSGVYWCALYAPYGSIRYTRLMEVRLSVDKRLQAQTPGEVSKREGSNLSVLCPYLAEDEYWELKSWCRWTGQGFQRQVAIISTITYQYTDRARQGHVTIQDDPIHRNFSITMTDLQVEDSGTYYCAYSHSNVPLKRISLNVFKEFHKWELDSLSVQCPYRGQVHLHGRKAWCRYVDQTGRCELVVSTDTTYTWSINKAQKDRASIQDDTQKRTITITMEKLQAQDSGVYWCALYAPYGSVRYTRLMEVRLSVDKRPAATTLSVTTGTSQTNPPGNSTQPLPDVNTYIIISVVLYLLLLLVVIILITSCIRHHKKVKRRGNRQAEDTCDKPGDTTQLESTERMGSPKDDNKDLKYVTLDFKSQRSPEEPLYCNVEPDQAHKNLKDENVEYAIIARD